MIQSVRQMSARLARQPASPRNETFAALYEAQFDRVYAFVRFRTGDGPIAEDIAAEVFTRAWSKLPDPGDRNAATAWLFTTARRLIVDHYRRGWHQTLAAVEESAHPSSPSPEAAAFSSERLALLTRCLTDLSDRERDVIGLRFVAQLRHREIGALVRTSEGNVAKILHRALGKLRDRLAAEGYTASDGLEGVTE
jgi:RNA polymerase sigma factor (sigma-70 family)